MENKRFMMTNHMGLRLKSACLIFVHAVCTKST